MSKKRIISLVASAAVVTTLFAGCATKGGNQAPGTGTGTATKVGMVTDSGTIDDKSFNQGTWEGIVKYKNDKKNIQEKYLQPSGEQKTDYMNAINDLVDSGYKLIVTPGFKFETAVNEAAPKHKDAAFILIDGQPNNGDGKFVKHDNVVSVFFNEHEAGFLAGVASALSTKTGKLGFIGGMEIPPVQKFGWGFKAGVHYANKTFGTKAEVADANYIYEGSFTNIPGGKNLAAGMYNRGVDIIFHSAGGVGVGVFNEAKERAEKGQNVFVVGVDVDQYESGKITSGKSVTLTSAMKRIDLAAYNYVDAKLNNKFPGGEIITLSLKDNGVGLPEKNPNLSEDVVKKVEQAKKDIVDGKVTVPATEDALKNFLK